METFILSHGSLDWNPPLAALWTAIAARSGRADPFSCTPAWQLSFHDAFAPRRRLFIHVDEENVLAFAELTLLSGHILLAPVEAHWISASPLLGPNADDLLVRLLPALADFYHGALPCLLWKRATTFFPASPAARPTSFMCCPSPPRCNAAPRLTAAWTAISPGARAITAPK